MDDDVDAFLYGGPDNGNAALAFTCLDIQLNSPAVAKPAPRAEPTKAPGKPTDDRNSESDSEDDVEIVLESTEAPSAPSEPDRSTGGFLKMSAKPVTNPAASTAEGAAAGSASLAGTFDINAVAMLDGEGLLDVDIEGFDEKPWRKPGADITDYFNFGFNELSWRQYCYKQKQLRDEFGADSYGPPQATRMQASPKIHAGQQPSRSPRIHQTPPASNGTSYSGSQRYPQDESSRRDDRRSAPRYPAPHERDRQSYRQRSRSRSRTREDRKRGRDAVEDSRERDSASRRRRIN